MGLEKLQRRRSQWVVRGFNHSISSTVFLNIHLSVSIKSQIRLNFSPFVSAQILCCCMLWYAVSSAFCSTMVSELGCKA